MNRSLIVTPGTCWRIVFICAIDSPTPSNTRWAETSAENRVAGGIFGVTDDRSPVISDSSLVLICSWLVAVRAAYAAPAMATRLEVRSEKRAKSGNRTRLLAKARE